MNESSKDAFERRRWGTWRNGASRLLTAAKGTSMNAYVVVSLLTDARTEELKALTWNHVDMDGDANGIPPTPPSIQALAVRAGRW
jgi:hypothetical protein